MLSEHDEQKLLIEWANLFPAWRELLFAIPNGGHRHIGTARKLKAEGVRAGIPDLMLARASGGFHGAFIEMKTQKGKPTTIQIQTIERLRNEGYYCEVCHGFEHAQESIRNYLNGCL